MVGTLERIVFVGRDIELRIVSLIVRARESANDVVFFDTGSNDETVELANEVGCEVLQFNQEVTPQSLCRHLLDLEASHGMTLFLTVRDEWKLSELPLSVNRAGEAWDIHFSFFGELDSDQTVDKEILGACTINHLIVSEAGAKAMSGLGQEATSRDVSPALHARFVKAEHPIRLPERQSLATASRFAQLFYWMLESKHPLLLFGIPGVVLFVLGYRLSGDLAFMFTELNSTSIGVTLATIAMTLVGLFAMMVALILYIMGKQVARVQHQYNWPRSQ